MKSQACASKRAVQDVLDHRNPEYIPLGLYTVDCDLASHILGRKTLVRDKIGQQLALWEGRRDEIAESIKLDAVELYRKLDSVDILLPAKCVPILPPRGYVPPALRKIDDCTWESEDGSVYRASFRTNEFVKVEGGAKLPSASDFSSFDFPPLADSIFEA
ncbi:MAG: hypothetical protein WCL50_15940 [Spirochaetota bacterium]